MSSALPGSLVKAIGLLRRQAPRLDDHRLKEFVRSFLDRRDAFLATAEVEGSPLYVIDTETLRDRSGRFRKAFQTALPDICPYYALKSNSNPVIATTLVGEGFGLDVSSGLELDLALSCGATEIVFSGPGKQPDEHKLAVANSDRVTVLIDSFSELAKLNRVAEESGTSIRAGVRLTTDDSGIWRKFGIPLSRLGEFFEAAQKCKSVDLHGLQFHLSWNLNPASQVSFIARLGAELQRLDKEHRTRLRFIDIGGGFWPEEGEWPQAAATPRGMLLAALGDTRIRGLEHYRRPACRIDEFADQISAALRSHLPEDVKSTICLEPGRWLCNGAMHMLLTVADVKAPDVVVTDGATNAIGWDRFETDYFPVINLTRPGLQEHECLVAGSLCTPHDLWGYSYFGEGIREGDILLVPNQGAYTYSLKQEFIKPVPRSVELRGDASLRATRSALATNSDRSSLSDN